MKLAKALKEKNKLVGEIQKLKTLIQQKNSYNVAQPMNYNTKELMNVLVNKLDKLIELKTKITFANAPIQSRIFAISEAKAAIQFLSSISTTEGQIVQNTYGGSTTHEFNAQIKELEIDAMKKQYELDIERFQDDMDAHNATTEIDFNLE